MDIKILVATHKKYWMPEDEVYLPLHVGREGKEDLGYMGDNTGDNISDKNANYCELTGLYWAWKNLDCEYIGLCHYRRYFSHRSLKQEEDERKKSIYGFIDYAKILRDYEIILPCKFKLKRLTVKEHYAKCHYGKDLDKVRGIITELYPEYIEEYDNVMKSNSLYICNMFVTKKEIFDKYCAWLFNILFILEKDIDITQYDQYQARLYGFLSERLFNVWLAKMNLKSYSANIVLLEAPQVNKIKHFIKYILGL